MPTYDPKLMGVADRRIYEDAPREDVELFQAWSDPATDYDRDQAIRLLCERLRVQVVKTNRTKHGNVEVVLRDVERG